MTDEMPRQDPQRPEQWSVPIQREDGQEQLRAITALAADGHVWVSIDGETFDFPPRDHAGHGGRSDRREASEMVAPMPATVTRLFVEAGDRVAAGQTVLILEAMKMELPVRAPREGAVAAVHCAVGDLVQPGRALIELAEVTDGPG